MYKRQLALGTSAFETSGGTLPCKGIIFRPWTSDPYPRQGLKQSIEAFVASIISYAIQHNLTTLG